MLNFFEIKVRTCSFEKTKRLGLPATITSKTTIEVLEQGVKYV